MGKYFFILLTYRVWFPILQWYVDKTTIGVLEIADEVVADPATVVADDSAAVMFMETDSPGECSAHGNHALIVCMHVGHFDH